MKERNEVTYDAKVFAQIYFSCLFLMERRNIQLITLTERKDAVILEIKINKPHMDLCQRFFSIVF